MIISYSNNFAFIRIPKSGSTSAATMIYDMGILDKSSDLCVKIEDASFGSDTVKRHNGLKRSDNTERDGFNIAYNKKLVDESFISPYFEEVKANVFWPFFMHTTWNKIKENGLIEDNMECISTIRHPVDRFISICYFFDAGTKERWPGTYINKLLEKSGLNGICDEFLSGERTFQSLHEFLSAPQSYYLSDNPTLWNIENLFDWAEDFASLKSGKVIEYYWAKRQIRPRAYFDNKIITLDRQKKLLDKYEKDFLLWENSYKRFN